MKRSLLLVFIFLCCLKAFPQKKIPSASLLKRYRYAANEAFKVNNFNLALSYALRADSLQPNEPDMHYISGVSYLYTSTKSKALPHLLQAKSKNYKTEELDFYLGQAYHYRTKFDSAIYFFKKRLTTLDTSSSATEIEQQIFKEIKTKIAQCYYGKQMVKDSLHVEIKNLGPTINTKYSEYVPIVNADESVMYFTSRRNTTTNERLDVDGKFYEDVYVSTFENGEWKDPKNAAHPVNSNDHDAAIGISPDGHKLFIYRSKSAKASSGNIFMSTLDGTEWKKPKKLGSNINSKDGWESSMCLTPDGKKLYFSSDRPGGMGGLDIYYAELNSEGEWGTPVNMGAPINTSDNEDAPFMHFDGKTLFFSSDGTKTIGGFDFFSSTYQADSAKWSYPLNLGYPINTADDDVYFVYSANGSKGYFSGNRSDSYGEKDIYVVNRPNVDPNMIVVAGHVLDKETKEPVFANVTITNLQTHKIIGVFNTNKLTGKYVLALNFGVNHSVTIEANGYIFNSENINVPNNEFKFQHNQDFFVEKVRVGAQTTLNNIFFNFQKSNLSPESITELDKMYEVFSSHPNWLVEISGHTDSIGAADYNMELSKSRALAVVNYLVAKGVNANSMLATGYGETKPVADNGTEEGRKQNRRTDFTIKKIYDDGTKNSISHEQIPLNQVLETSGQDSVFKLKMKVHFMPEDGEHLTSYSQEQLNQIVDYMKKNKQFKIQLHSSVDVVGNEHNNKKLHDLRVKTVSHYLHAHGLGHDRIIAKEFVPSKHPRINDHKKADIKNRRVEFVLVEY